MSIVSRRGTPTEPYSVLPIRWLFLILVAYIHNHSLAQHNVMTHPVAVIRSVARSRLALSVFQRAPIKLYVCCGFSVIRTLKRCVGIINSPLNRNQHQKMFSPLFYLSCSNIVTMQWRERLGSRLMIPHKPQIVFHHWAVWQMSTRHFVLFSKALERSSQNNGITQVLSCLVV